MNKYISILFCILTIGIFDACKPQEPIPQPKNTDSSLAMLQTISNLDIDENNWVSDCEKKWQYLIPKAESGDAEAQNELAHLYYDSYNMDCASRGILSEEDAHDAHKALNWFLKSAQQGNLDSIFMVGYMYMHGPDLYDYPQQDSKEAEKWFLKLVEQDNHRGDIYLARMYTEGLGMPKNLPKGRQWANSALQAFPDEKAGNYYLGVLAYDNKQYDQALNYWKKCTDNSDECDEARYQLSKMYLRGIGVKKDIQKASEYYEKDRVEEYFKPILPDEDIKTVDLDRLWHNAVYDNDSVSQYELGRRYERGEGVTQDKVRATEWYAKAAQQNNQSALYSLAMIDVEDSKGNGHLCLLDWIPERVALLKRAADQGHSQAALELSKLYQTGAYIHWGDELGTGKHWRWTNVIIGRDLEKSKYYLEKANQAVF